ncbi:MAG TPA: DUF2141 domain-containing protein [Aliidongia sp.]|uniref:DUF2141 domain-containing protein n=1 Tax=Aliidongia sp. TaxID=1914230 RepID=UPI002DDCC959|nr:DUF2141 domain-containing protein [Aliidongia sp.]HEV2678444.1 DUF2141 domain-containing protein [Aliidongia sp.]
MGRITHGATFGLMACGLLALSPTQAAAPGDCNAADPNQVRLQVGVSGMHSTDGAVSITIYPDDTAHFLDGAYKLARQEVPVTLPVTRACFTVAAPGHYAVALFHDENGNHHFDTTMLGLPAEGYGFSNNPTLYLGPPSLSQVRFAAHAGDNPVDVLVKY